MARPRRSEKTRRDLLDFGVEILTDQGYHGTGLKELLDSRKVPKGSFYNYFKSKEHFGAEVVRHYSLGVEALLDHILSSREDQRAALEQFFEAVADGHEGRQLGCLVGNLTAELGAGYDQIREAMKAALHCWRDRFEIALSRAQLQGTVRDDLPAAEMADFLMNGFEGALLRMRLEQSTEPLRSFARLTLRGFFGPR